jgi:pyrimidine-nucleoside phosphorylase
MNQPLGEAVGNALEVVEAINTLHGKGPRDFTDHCMTVASHMLVLGGKARGLDQAKKMATEALYSGNAWSMFRKLVEAQGGDVRFIDNPEKLPKARLKEEVCAEKDGCLKAINARIVGETSVDLGAGRVRKEDTIDHAVGIIVHKKVGDRVKKGESIFAVHANEKTRLANAAKRLQTAVEISRSPQKPLPLFYDVIK